MRRLLFISLAACVLVTTSILSASAMPVAKPNMLADSDGIVLVKGGHGHGHGHHMRRGGHGHHYGWHRNRGHHYGWYKGRHRGRHS
jgi:hypothetical protein